MTGWDNLTDAELDAMPAFGLQTRLLLYTLVAIDHKQKPDYPEIDQALNRAAAAFKRRGDERQGPGVAGGGVGREPGPV
jgi:hypothetical protein